VVFVADSQEERLDANLETLDNLREHLKDHNLDFNTIPYVLQLNKRDLPNILPVAELQKQLAVKSEPALEAVAITGQGKTRGMAAVLCFETTINQHIAFITPRTAAVSPEFLHLAFTGAYRTLRALSEDSGSTKGALTCEDLKRFKVALPPQQEQAALVDHIHSRTQTLDAIVTHTEREIELLREYRTRLVADVVTGKLDVRAAAVHLPAEEKERPAPIATEDLPDEAELELVGSGD